MDNSESAFAIKILHLSIVKNGLVVNVKNDVNKKASLDFKILGPALYNILAKVINSKVFQ
jgi:hypothetical protein